MEGAWPAGVLPAPAEGSRAGSGRFGRRPGRQGPDGGVGNQPAACPARKAPVGSDQMPLFQDVAGGAVARELHQLHNHHQHQHGGDEDVGLETVKPVAHRDVA